MRPLASIALLPALLLGQAPLRIQTVERRGLPPYEEASTRLYRLDGGENRGLRSGDRLLVRRAGEGTLAHLRVVEVRAEWALATLDQSLAAYPLRGDLVVREELPALPALPAFGDAAVPPPPRPALGSSAEAPPQEGLLWFLPDSRALSPAGEAKLTAWVEAWGREGRWSVLIPEDTRVAEPMKTARFEALREALARHGVAQVERRRANRGAEGPNHPLWIQHWD